MTDFFSAEKSIGVHACDWNSRIFREFLHVFSFPEFFDTSGLERSFRWDKYVKNHKCSSFFSSVLSAESFSSSYLQKNVKQIYSLRNPKQYSWKFQNVKRIRILEKWKRIVLCFSKYSFFFSRLTNICKLNYFLTSIIRYFEISWTYKCFICNIFQK